MNALAHRSDGPEPRSVETCRAEMSERAGRLGLEIADISGIVEDLAGLSGKQVQSLREVVDAARSAAATNSQLAATMHETRSAADEARAILSESAGLVSRALVGSIDKMQVLSRGVLATTSSLNQVRETIAKVQEASAAIQMIAYETQIIALNAGVEAARVGEAGQGFAIIGRSIKQLADQVRSFADQNDKHLAALQETLGELEHKSKDNVATAEAAIRSSKDATGATERLQSLVSGVEQLTGKIMAMNEPVQGNIRSGERVRDNLRGLIASVKQVDGSLAVATERCENILGISEDLMLFIAESGIAGEDTKIIAAAQDTAQKISGLFTDAVSGGQIGMSQVFDENYIPVPGSNPEQVMTQFTLFTDRVLPAIQEAVLTQDPRIAFCAAIDRNGYLPTHNRQYSKPQGPDPVWNAANCRNRRLFNDRTGLAAGRNQKRFLVQTYRRDMGNGNFVLMKDVSAPITVLGRHWGGFRIGFKV